MILRPLGGSHEPPGPSNPRLSGGSSPVGADPVDQAILGGGEGRPAPAPAGVGESARPVEAPPAKPAFAPGELLVKLAPGLEAGSLQELQDRMGLRVLRRFDLPPAMQEGFGGELFQFGLKAGDTVEAAVERLSGQPGVLYAEPNYLVELGPTEGGAPTPAGLDLPAQGAPAEGSGIPDDLDPRLWGLRNQGQGGGTAGVDIGAAGAWGFTTGAPGGAGPLIAVIDTGIDYKHPDLAGNLWTNPGEIPGDGIDNDGNGVIDDVHGANLAAPAGPRRGDPMDDNQHGSHCAGTIGAVGDNGQGVVGVQWGATMAGVKFLTAKGGGTYADAIESVLYATRIGARVTSNSWGGAAFSQALMDAFSASPALHIAAAGNSGLDADRKPHYPSGFEIDHMVSVAAHDRSDRLARFSNYGATTVDLAAPGVDILSTVPGGDYKSFSGTSMATPHVAGAVGLMLSLEPGLTNQQLKDRLLGTVVRSEAYEGKTVSGGRLNAAAALEQDQTPPAAPLDFQISQAGATSMGLTWTATGDDGVAGRATRYELRGSDRPFSERPGPGQASWEEGIPLGDLPRPGQPGAPEALQVRITPEPEGRARHFALKVVDNVGLESPMVAASASSRPAGIAFGDDFEGEGGWTAEGTWARVEAPGRGLVYTDSPGGAYRDGADLSLVSQPVDLSALEDPRLVFDLKIDTEKGFDGLAVEVSEDGARWTELARFDGFSDWSRRDVGLGAFQGRQVQVRFRFQSDQSLNKDGVYLDRVLIAGEPKGR